MPVVGTLTTGIAHEIQNQLTILGYAEVIKMAVPDNQQVAQYVKNILDTRNRILSIVDEIRQFARNQEQEYEKSLMLLTEVINMAVNIMQYDTDAKKRSIVKEFQTSPMMMLNRDKMIQVIINLIRNAVQATGLNGTITVIVSENRNHVCIEIRDDGCGIAPEHAEKIWTPFFTTKGEQGTGLGLEICKRIIEGHSGQIFSRVKWGKARHSRLNCRSIRLR